MADDFPTPIVTIDVVPLTISEGRLCVLRALRDKAPYQGQHALVGGYVHLDKDAHLGETARRVLRTKAGLADLYVEQLSTFSGAKRDPRGWSVSVVYFSLSHVSQLDKAIKQGLELTPVDQASGMPFDHDLILSAALQRLRGKGAYSDLPARFLPPEFTLSQLHEAYEIALGENLNMDAFRRKVMALGFITETGNKRRTEGANRPSALFRLRQGVRVFDRRL